MTILAVDPGYAKCGWAIVEPVTGRVRALGVILTAKDPKVTLATDRTRRMGAVAAKLAELAAEHSVTVIAAEEPLGFGAAAAVAANQLPWGALVMLATMLDVSLYAVTAKTWQRAVLGIEVKNVDYAQVEKLLADYVAGQAAEQLAAIAPSHRNHALDGGGVGVVVALRPREATLIRRVERVVHHDLKQAKVLAKSVDEVSVVPADLVQGRRKRTPTKLSQHHGEI
jgi:Holliday junction resolvasome RuvABC endonuclease subunit